MQLGERQAGWYRGCPSRRIHAAGGAIESQVASMTDRSGSSGFTRLEPVPDHPTLELEVLARWDRDGTFDLLRKRNEGGPNWSFIDGPVTANKTLGVHTAWGRTLKDVFQRYKAMGGFDQRFQNGYDCQGLWIEVAVEKQLGLNSKREIEEYGLERFAQECRDLVERSARELTRGSKRLGYWMDWGRDYFTFSDTNIEYIWRFLKIIDQRGWLYLGHRSTEWCPRCGTSLSQHELSQSGVYQDVSDPSLFARLPLLGRAGESLMIWTTTPWTLPANVAAAVHPEAPYGRRPTGEWVAVDRFPEEQFAETVLGSEMVGWRYEGPFDTLGPGAAVSHVVIPWVEVTLDQGTGIVHIAPGAGAEDFELAKEHDLPVLAPVDEAGRFYDEYGWLAGLETAAAAEPIISDLDKRGLLVEAATYQHSYPHCWRCNTPLIFRVADDWFIGVDEIRPSLLKANSTVQWTPDYMSKRMDDWLNNMGDWNISRRRYYGLPLPFYPCTCGHLNVIGSRAELYERATEPIDDLPELHRPWIDRIKITCEACGEAVDRVPEVGDVWLDAGIVPFSTLGWENPESIDEGSATGSAAGLTTADLPDHAYWEKWFPAHWVSEMREQIRLWFYSQLFMSVALVGKAPFQSVLGYEKMLAEDGREMHGSWGNLIPAEEAFRQMGADVMRWQYCQQPPDRNLLFGYGPATVIKRKLITLWNSARFLTDYGSIEGFVPSFGDLEGGPTGVESRPTDRWLLARTQRLVAEATSSLERQLTHQLIDAFDGYLDDLSNWYIRRNRRRFYSYDQAAFRTLWYSLVQALRVIAPVLPFLTDHLWKVLVAEQCPEAPSSVFLAPWPELSDALVDEELLRDMEITRTVVELGRQARASAGIRLRQPLARAHVHGAPAARAHEDEIKAELRVKDLVFDEGPIDRVDVKPDYARLGPRLGSEVKEVARALAAGDYEDLADGSIKVGSHLLGPEDLVRKERAAHEGLVIAHEGGISVALDIALDDELLLEGEALDLIRVVNEMRKQAGLELTDRIKLELPPKSAAVVERHQELIANEVLAIEVVVVAEARQPSIGRVEV